MLTGLVSITFRELAPDRIIELVAEAGLDGIEWGGDVHAPHGDVAVARDLGDRTRDAGLRVLAYGSYYRLGQSDNPPFDDVIQSAEALGADLVRIWAGRGKFADFIDDDRRRIADEARQVADRAADAGLTLAFEYHRNTLTETAESTRALLEAVDRRNVKTLWQPNPQISVDENEAALRTVLPWLVNLHVFSWDEAGTRLPLAAGAAWWARYLAAARDRAHAGLIEFVAEASPEQFLRDARTLKGWLAEFTDA